MTCDTHNALYVHAVPGVTGQMLAGEAVVLVPHRGTVEVLNEIGARIWQLADGTRTLETIACCICAEYDVGRADAIRDTTIFVQQLVSRGVLVMRSSC